MQATHLAVCVMVIYCAGPFFRWFLVFVSVPTDLVCVCHGLTDVALKELCPCLCSTNSNCTLQKKKYTVLFLTAQNLGRLTREQILQAVRGSKSSCGAPSTLGSFDLVACGL